MQKRNDSKKIYRSNSNKVFGGVLAGFAKYFEIDTSLMRIIYVVISILSAAFPGILVYLIAWIIIPPEPNI